MESPSPLPLLDFVKRGIEFSQGLTSEKVWDLIINAPVYYEKWWLNLWHEAPQHVLIETTLVLFIIWLLFIRRTVDPKKPTEPAKLSQKEIDWLLETWEPEPLAPKVTASDRALVSSTKVIEKWEGDYMTLHGVSGKVLNASSFDFFGFAEDNNIKQAARDALEKYGCGSCGPRGFYGTLDQHITLEKEFAEFMQTQEAIHYSDSASTVASAIPAFCKKGDLLIVDEACSEPILTGVTLSRSTIKYFKHNDMDDLARLLQAIAEDDRRLRRDTTQQRRFIVVEGLYRSTGELCPLPRLLQLKEQYFYRLILDESTSFGVLGATGRGLAEHFGISRDAIEVTTVAMDTVLCSVGGLCVGTREIVDHQRLSGAGYCYSASTAPFLVAAAVAGLKKLDQHSRALVSGLQVRTVAMHNALQGLSALSTISKEATPVVHLVCKQAHGRDEEVAWLSAVVERCVQDGLGVSLSKYGVKFNTVRPSILMTVHATFTDELIGQMVRTLEAACRATK